ncbi:MAG TPA: AMP-binding protein [Hyphomicrobiales bacterium]|nr:AMP-binding protein [Hyphomicrobiales bacterium]
MSVPAPPPTIVVDGEATPARLLARRAREWADRPALRHKRRGIWQTTTWRDYGEAVEMLAAAMAGAGIGRGSVVAVMAEGRPEWVEVAFAALTLGAVVAAIYPTTPADRLGAILAHCGAGILFVEDEEQLDKAIAARARAPRLQRIVVIDLKGLRNLDDESTTALADFLAQGRAAAASHGEAIRAERDAGRPDDIALLLYSGRGGARPKAAAVTNANLMFQIRAACGLLGAAPPASSVSLVSPCHPIEQALTVQAQLGLGQIVHFPENAATAMNDLCEVVPELVFAPPRVWESFRIGIERLAAEAAPLGRSVFRLAMAAGPASVPGRLLRRAVLGNVRARLGMGRVRYAFVGGGPVSEELRRWADQTGIPLLEVYGSAETAGLCTASVPGRAKPGTAGRRLDGLELRTDGTGEIWVRGPGVFAGYWPMGVDRTASSEWLAAGDLAEIDGDGFVAWRGRVEDTLTLATGETVSAHRIEARLRTCPHIGDGVVAGGGRHGLVGLVVLDAEAVTRFAQERQLPINDIASLARDPAVQALIASEIAAATNSLPAAQRLQRFRILDRVPAPGDEELTPMLTLDRRVMLQRYQGLIAEIDAEDFDTVTT